MITILYVIAEIFKFKLDYNLVVKYIFVQFYMAEQECSASLDSVDSNDSQTLHKSP